jgi:hypothetical protein
MPFVRTTVRCTAATAVAALVALGHATPARSQVNALESFRSALIDYFKVLNFVPVLVDRGYKTGDVIEADGVNLMARAAQCFPDLKEPPAVEQSLPSAVQTDSAAVSFGLKLRQLFDSNAGANLVKNIRLSFTEVTIVAVTRLDLMKALDRTACGDISALVDGTAVPVDRTWKPRFVVSEVMSGMREATLTFADNANLQAKLDKIAQEFGNAELTVRAGTDGAVTLKTSKRSVIAVKPVTVPQVKLASFADPTRAGTELDLKWEPLQCDTPQACRQLFDPFADLVKASKPVLEPSEVDK